MADETERVTVRLPHESVEALESLVKSGEYSNLSDAIRSAIDRLLEIQFAPNNVRKLTIELPKGNVVDMEQLVNRGDSISLEDAIRNAVREYVRRRMDRAIEKRQKK